MNEQESWIERRQRIVRCKAHGLHYDPKLASGCTLCHKEASRTFPERAPQLTIILLCVLGMTFVLYQIFGPEGGEGAAALALGPPEEEAGAVRLDPEPYRRPIQALESALAVEVEARDLAGAGEGIAATARLLSDAIRQREPDAGVLAAGAIARLGEGITADTFGFGDLEQARGVWLEIRRRHLRAAPWFVPPPTDGVPRQRAALAEYRAVAADLVALMQEGAAEARATADSVDGDGEASWREYLPGWRERIGELWKRQPERPGAAASAEVLTATQALERSFQRAWALASDPSVAAAGNPAGRFDEVLFEAEAARRAFEAVEL